MNAQRWLSLRTALPVLAMVVFLMAWNRGIALLYGMFALVVATFMVGYLAPWWNLRGLRVSRSHPATVNAGEALPLRLTLSRQGRLKRYLIAATDRIPCAEPGEEAPMIFVERVGRAVEVAFPVPCDWRGEHRLGPLAVETAFPLGIHRVRRDVPASTSSVLVYPAAREIPWFPGLAAAQAAPSGGGRTAVAGGATEFMGVREYRRGDSPRHVHWGLSARRGELMVREFEFVSTAQVCLLLDLDAGAVHGEGRNSSFEHAVTVAAAVARYALAQGHRVQLLGYGEQPVTVPPGHGESQLHRILEALARVQPNGELPYRQAVLRAQGTIPPGSTLVTFERANRDGSPVEVLPLSSRVHPVRLLFDGYSYDYPLARSEPVAQQPTARVPQYVLRHGDDPATVFRRPA
ncbi:DUF58 domain-containing protein [Arhodomonas sp. AD133]|uniref:DUF58 domain-containing protein n=1 Tax=Arhodomonas sp. AD133 TaxID=3415009 RepID=UPI003EB80B20